MLQINRTILIPIKLESDDFGPWAVVFIPFWAGLAFLLLVDVEWPNYKPKFHNEDEEMWIRMTSALWLNGVVGLAITTILLVIRLDGPTIPWGVIFTPLFYLAFLVLLFSVTAFERLDGLLGLLIILFSLPVILFVLLLFLLLEGYVGSLAIPFIPVFIVDVVLFVGGCSAYCIFN